ncbi:hypothetical protein [Halorhabdus salina]|uniref:hypothetical protein n=1 Tax=Halorhabdus salina TaxID=2750670 RepID=UPI0015EF7F1A|nr:hypothetical protein [Halorhabdus salina]
MQGLTRRELLVFGATAAGVGIAGCAERGESDSTHADWIPATQGTTLTGYVDFTLSEDESAINPLLPLVVPSDEDDTTRVPDFPDADEIADPLLQVPIRTGGQIIFTGLLTFGIVGLGYLYDPAQPNQGVTELFVADNAIVGLGDVDTTRVDETLRSGGDGPFATIEFQRLGESEEYTLYEPVNDDGSVVAVSGGAIVMSENADRTRAAIAAHRGETPRAVDENDTLAWLFETAGSGHLVIGWAGSVDFESYFWEAENAGPSPAFITATDDVMSSLTFRPDAAEITGEMAIQKPEVTDETRDTIENQLGATGEDRSLSFEGNRVSVSSTFAQDAVDFDFVEATTPTPTMTPVEDPDVPSEVAEAVPAAALAFEFVPEEDAARVSFESEMAVDRITLRAVESGYEISTETPQEGMYVNVYLAPDGDEVLVTATVNDTTAQIASREFPGSSTRTE